MAESKLTAKKELKPKQREFAEQYLIDLNATQAAIRAGYSEKTAAEMGYENLNKPHIADFIVELKAKRSAKTEITAEYVLSSLHKVAERCMQEVPVMEYDKDAGEHKEIGEFKFEHSGANKSLELLGKHLALFTEKTETVHSIDLSKLSDEELNAIATGTPIT